MAEYELSAGQMVGEYRVERKIGEGGFGKVYAAVHPVIGKAAAVKILNPQLARSPEIVTRFVDEARAVNQIRHRNIIDIFAFGTLPGGLHYFVMEMLEGTPLDAYVKQNAPLDPAHALSLLWPVGRALVAAHKAGITHRDLKPENVFLTVDHEGVMFPKLLDFGIAKLLHEGEMANRTKTGAMMGTPYYMSPEQVRGVGVDHRSDIYSFGIMVHEVLTGRQPFQAENVMDLLMKQISEAPPPMSRVRPDLPPALDAPVLRMLEKSADRRPQTMQAALDELAAAARSAGIDIAAAAQGSIVPQQPRTAPPQATGPAGGPTPATAPHLDTAAWLQQGSASASRPAATGPGPGTSQHTPGPPQQTGPSQHRTPAPQPTVPQPFQPSTAAGTPGAWGPGATQQGPGQHAPAAQYATPTPAQAVSGYGPGYPHGAVQEGGAPQAHAGYAGHAPQRSSATGIIIAAVVGLFLLFVGGTVITLVAIGSQIEDVQIRAEAPPVGAVIDRNIRTSMDMGFSAPGDAQPRVRGEVRTQRQYRFTVLSVTSNQITRAEVRYLDTWTTSRVGQEAPETESAPVSNRAYVLTGQAGSTDVQAADGHALSEDERNEVLADVGDMLLPRSGAFAAGIDVGQSVSLTSGEALALLGLASIEEGTTTRADRAAMTLVSVEGDRARFDITLNFVQDGGDPAAHIEGALKGTVTLDVRSGLPVQAQLEGPVTGSVSSGADRLTISGTMKLEGN